MPRVTVNSMEVPYADRRVSNIFVGSSKPL